MKKSNYILLTFSILLFGAITFYFIDTLVNKSEIDKNILENYHFRQSVGEINLARNIAKEDPTDYKKWENFTSKLKTYKNTNHIFNRGFLNNNAEYILDHYSFFKDSTILNLMKNLYKDEFESFDKKTYYEKNVYSEILYELKEVKKAKEIERIQNNKKIAKTPVSVKKWLDNELSKKAKKPLASLESSDFFHQSKARIVGYINGYNGNQSLKFNTAMIFLNEHLSNTSYPELVTIHPDGRFEADITLKHPIYSKININNKWVPFYLEPQQTLAIIINSNNLYQQSTQFERYCKDLLFMGPLSKTNYELANYNFEKFDYKKNAKKTQEFSPKAYKNQREKQLKYNLENYNTYINKKTISNKTAKIIKNTILVGNAIYLMNYLQYHPTDTLIEPLNKIYKPKVLNDFYSFLTEIPWDDQSLLLTDSFSEFINNFEFLDRFHKEGYSYTKDNYISINSKIWKTKDSITTNLLYLDTTSFIYNITKIRTIKPTTNYFKNNKQPLAYWNTIKTTSNPFLLKEASKIITETLNRQNGYELPNTKGAEIFEKITAPFKNKIVLVKFWNYSTGSYMLKKQLQNSIKTIEEKYNQEIVIIYITEDNAYFDLKYNLFVKEQKLTNSFKIPVDEVNHLRQLFRKSNSNFWVIKNTNGKVISDNFRLNDVETEIQKMIAKRE